MNGFDPYLFEQEKKYYYGERVPGVTADYNDLARQYRDHVYQQYRDLEPETNAKRLHEQLAAFKRDFPDYYRLIFAG